MSHMLNRDDYCKNVSVALSIKKKKIRSKEIHLKKNFIFCSNI